MRAGAQRKRLMIGAAALALVAAIPAVNALRPHSAQAASALPGDGTTNATAGASCWGIKQQYPASASGVYWLNTAALERPTQFACDMTTDGGGWVLVARGRQGWNFAPTGQGSPTTLRTTTDGTGAFSPAALPSATIAQLLDGTGVKDLPDGIRLERAKTSDGSQRQDYRLYPTWKNWTWAFPAGEILTKVVADGQTYQGSNTYDTYGGTFGQTTNQLANVQGYNRLFTYAWSSHNNQKGFSFGNGINGSNSSTNYLWSNSNEGHAIPFTKVWIRPKVLNSAAGFTPIPAGGYAAKPKPATLKARSEIAPYGVVGMDHTNETTIEPYKTNVLSMRVAGSRVFVGGRFTGVQQGPAATAVTQKYLASFDLDGNWNSDFRPTLDGRVWDMVVLPDGKLLVAGDFTNVNGAPNTSGVAKLDPATGAVDPTFKATFTRDGGRPLVRALDQRDGTVYAAGDFNQFTGADWNPITVTSAISFSATDGRPGTWKPRPNGQVVRIRVTKAADRVMLAGYFKAVNADTNMGYYAITDIATGNPSAGIGPWAGSLGSGTKLYQQAVADLGDGRYIVGGSEHDFQIWDRNRTQLLEAKITKQGGDTQAIEILGGKIYYACHCGNWVYEGTNNWSSPTGFRTIEPMNLVGAVDPTTMEYDTSWYPSGLKGASGEGVWTIDQDSRGCLWVGGDLNRGSYSGVAATDFLGGFARFCQEDVTPPTQPSSFTAGLSGTSVNLKWGAASDATGTVSYDVYRDDRVIATTYGTSFVDPDVSGTHAYTVRAVDIRGNQSSSPAPITVNGPATKIATPIPFGSTWKYKDDGSNQGTAWRAAAFDDSAWASGAGRLGWGTTGNATTLGATHPLTTYYRTSFNVADASQVKIVSLQAKVLTGAVYYVNGVEVGRYNMAPGVVTSSSTAAGYLTTAQENATTTLVVPGSVLRNGANSFAVEVHNMRAGGTRGWFDLSATTFGTGGEANAPTAPVLTATPGSGGTTLTWTPATDDVAIGGYVIARDGQTIAVTDPLTTSWGDAGVDTASPHTYQVTAFDTYGNTATSNTQTVAPQANPNVLAYGATWRWAFPTGGAPADWNTTAFDDSAWASGPAEFGYGDSDEKTIISTNPAPRPVTAYFRTTVTVDDPSAFATVLAQLIRDDGAVVYVNGVEVGRDNLPAGTITPTTLASTVLSTRAQETTPASISIPASAFTPGANTIAVEVHNSDPYSGDLSFDLKLTGQK